MEKLITVEQAAEILVVAPATVREWLRTGQLKGVKLKKMWRIREKDIIIFLESGNVTTPAE